MGGSILVLLNKYSFICLKKPQRNLFALGLFV